MSSQGVKVEGINELVSKLKRLDDKVTRREVLKVQRRSARPLVAAYKKELPLGNRDKERFGTTYPAGTLRKSVRAVTVPATKVGGNPQVVVRPSKKGRYKGWYAFMVVPEDTKVGSTAEGSRKGLNTVTEDARDRVVAMRNALVTRDYEVKMAKMLQNQINRIS